MAAHLAPGTKQTTELHYVIALGNYALEALVGITGITDKRGSVFPLDLDGRRVQVLCTFNPAHVMREPRMEVVFRMDLNKLTRLREGKFCVPRIECVINPNLYGSARFPTVGTHT